MDPEEIARIKREIDDMSQLEMARLWRFAPVGSVYFNPENKEVSDYFSEKFRERGGMNPYISKEIGWG